MGLCSSTIETVETPTENPVSYQPYQPLSLTKAISNRFSDRVLNELLNTQGVDVNEESSDKFAIIRTHPDDIVRVTPLIKAMLMGQIDIVNRLLLRDDLDVNRKVHFGDLQGQTALHIAISYLIDEDFMGEMITLLLTKTEMNVKDAYGETPLFLAVKESNLVAIDLLLSQSGIDVNQATHKGCTPLIAACSENDVEVVKRLLSVKSVDIDINKAEDNSSCGGPSNTALMVASQNGHIEIVRLLLSNISEIDINKANNDGLTALVLAKQEGHVEIVALLKDESLCLFVQVKQSDHKI